MKAGAQFGLAPGFNPAVCEYAINNNFPFVPGVMTPSEAEQAAEKGFTILKLFPAAQINGPAFLKALREVYTQLQLQFIPMGGVSINNMQEYLQQKCDSCRRVMAGQRELISSNNSATLPDG